jgi:hypothetical protein
MRLEPDHHPVPHDSVPRLLISGVRAVSRRFDVRLPMKVLFAGWFTAMAVAPRPVVRTLAERFLFPEQRRTLNRLLATLHRGRNEALVD